MAFADLKNDFVFRRIFATHPDLLRSLLNDLLGRSGDRAIDATRIEACKDLVVLDRWIKRVATAASVEEVLATTT